MGGIDHFQQESRYLHHQRVIVILLAGIAVLLLFILLDSIVAPTFFAEFLGYRVLAAGVCSLLLLANYFDRSYRWPGLIGFSGYLAVGITIVLTIYRQDVATTPYYVGLIVAMTIYSTLAPLTVIQTLASGFVLISLYRLVIVFMSPADPSQQLDLFSHLFFMICFVFIAATQSWTDINARKREHLLRISEQEATKALKNQASNLEQEVKRRTEAQKAVEKHFQALFEAIADDVVLLSPEGTILQANCSFLEHFIPGQLQPGPLFSDLVPPEERQTLHAALSTLLATGTPVSNYRLTLNTIHGTPLKTEINGVLMQRKGKVLGVQLVIRDISERNRLEEQLIASLRRVRYTENATILALAKLSEYRDITPGRHLERIREYCKTLATALHQHHRYAAIITPAYIQNLYQGCILHDIGKVAVSNVILEKTGPLTVLEEEALRNHTLSGGDIIKAMEQETQGSGFLSLAKNIAYFHHERWDGSGYPYGLQGNEIPLEARIMALADAYEETTAALVHEQRSTHQQAVDMIVKNAGRRFDPRLVETFISVQEDFDQIRCALAESKGCRIPNRNADWAGQQGCLSQ